MNHPPVYGYDAAETKESTLVTVASEERNENSSLAKLEKQTTSQEPLDARVLVTGLSVEPMDNAQTNSAQGTTTTLEKALLMSDVSSNANRKKKEKKEKEEKEKDGKKDEDKDDDDDGNDDDEEEEKEKKQKEKEEIAKEEEKEKEEKENEEEAGKVQEEGNENGIKDTTNTPAATVNGKEDGAESTQQVIKPTNEEVNSTTVTNGLSPDLNQSNKDTESVKQPYVLPVTESFGETQPSIPVGSPMLTTPIISRQSTEESPKSDDITPSTEEAQIEAADHTFTVPVEMSDDLGTSGKPTDLPVSENADEAPASTPVVSAMPATLIALRQSTEENLKSDDVMPKTEGGQTEAADQISKIPEEMSDDLGTLAKPTDLPVSENADEAPASTPVVSSMQPTPTASGQSTEENQEEDEVPSSTEEGQIGATGDQISATTVWYDMGTPTMPAHSTENSVSLQSDGATPSTVDEQTETTGIVSAGPVE
ncbi:unnamed protein product, partial [Dibothriocephalus latus]